MLPILSTRPIDALIHFLRVLVLVPITRYISAPPFAWWLLSMPKPTILPPITISVLLEIVARPLVSLRRHTPAAVCARAHGTCRSRRVCAVHVISQNSPFKTNSNVSPPYSYVRIRCFLLQPIALESCLMAEYVHVHVEDVEDIDAGGTHSTFTSCGPHSPYTFTSCGLHPPYCCFVPVIPVALSCPTAADTSSKLLPLAGCAANLNTAVYDFMTNSWYLRRTSMRTVHGRSSIRIHSSDASFEPCHFESSIRNF